MIPGALNSNDCSVHDHGDILLLRFDLRKFRWFAERVSLAATGLEHQNFVMQIRGALPKQPKAPIK